MFRVKPLIAFLALSALTVVGPAAHAQLTFNINAAAGTDPTALADFQRAAARWSSLFTDPITVNLNFSFTNLNSNMIIGQTQENVNVYDYSVVRGALVADAKSSDDASAVGHLQNLPSASRSGGASFNMITNRTSDNGNSATPYLDNNGGLNNSLLQITNANAKALGIYGQGVGGPDAQPDATITFNSGFAFDFNPDDGINGSQEDFVGVATHEIGHALGFFSGVDILESNTNRSGDSNYFVNTLDLYRFSADSIANGNGTVDFTADARDKYFSVDGGGTSIVNYSTGRAFGDGQQASHWKDNDFPTPGINGIMDPTAANGELLMISQNDIRAFDVIGYDLAPTPEPSSPAALSLGALGLVILLVARRRRCPADA